MIKKTKQISYFIVIFNMASLTKLTIAYVFQTPAKFLADMEHEFWISWDPIFILITAIGGESYLFFSWS